MILVHAKMFLIVLFIAKLQYYHYGFLALYPLFPQRSRLIFSDIS